MYEIYGRKLSTEKSQLAENKSRYNYLYFYLSLPELFTIITKVSSFCQNRHHCRLRVGEKASIFGDVPLYGASIRDGNCVCVCGGGGGGGGDTIKYIIILKTTAKHTK